MFVDSWLKCGLHKTIQVICVGMGHQVRNVWIIHQEIEKIITDAKINDTISDIRSQSPSILKADIKFV